MCLCVSGHMHTCTVAHGGQKRVKESDIFGVGVRGGYELLSIWPWSLTSGPLQKQYALLTHEPSPLSSDEEAETRGMSHDECRRKALKAESKAPFSPPTPAPLLFRVLSVSSSRQIKLHCQYPKHTQGGKEALGPGRPLHRDTPTAGKVKYFIESTRSQFPSCPEQGIVDQWAAAGSFPRMRAGGEQGGRIGRGPVVKTEGTWVQDGVQANPLWSWFWRHLTVSASATHVLSTRRSFRAEETTLWGAGGTGCSFDHLLATLWGEQSRAACWQSFWTVILTWIEDLGQGEGLFFMSLIFFN